MNAVYQHLVTTLTDKFEAPEERVRPAATLGDLDLDSLAVVELFVTLQEHWDIPLDDSDADATLTVDEVASAVNDLIHQRDIGAA
ncbi:acyl carrier protein [Streptomyces sp. H27-D2]|uniref:acyl carrier protein n=1 Tax=Streptomyces sp. H27-D2 TaxID=3046304 RepID=UPI002DB67265|nr:acyl carrier protein [Streptomyces sp. H27-D2]MEC4020684.1 acyl carrier protein [Streptomyces sp. H27-D2]